MVWLIYCQQMVPYDPEELCQHWLRELLASWWHQAITAINAALFSVMSSDIHPLSEGHVTLCKDAKLVMRKFYTYIGIKWWDKAPIRWHLWYG